MWGVLFGGGDWAVCLHSINEGQWVVGGGGWLYTLATTDDACKVEKITLFLSLLTEDLFIRMGKPTPTRTSYSFIGNSLSIFTHHL